MILLGLLYESKSVEASFKPWEAILGTFIEITVGVCLKSIELILFRSDALFEDFHAKQILFHSQDMDN